MSLASTARRQFAAAAFALQLCASGAGAVVIDFDTAPDGSPIAGGTDVTLTYASLGVTFGRDGGKGCGPAVYASAEGPAGFGSPPNVVSTCGGSSAADINGEFHGRIRADFNRPATRVCVDVRPDNATLNAVLSVHDADDQLIVQIASQPGVTGTICATGAGIRHARFPGTGDTDTEYATFDNLDVTFAETPPNFEGLWWNPQESGWGINFAHQGDIIFATWFTFGADNKPQWYTIRADKTATNVYAGPVSSFTGLPFNTLPYTANANVKTAVGTATITFAADGRSASFTYTVNGITQTKQIVPQEFASPVPSCIWGAQTNLTLATNYQNLWWVTNGDEAGWGINFTHQGKIVFATWFTYDADGKALWLFVVATETAVPKVYAGPLKTATGPPFSAEPFDPNAVVRSTVGEATITVIDGNHATFDYTLNGVTQSKSLVRQVFAAPGTVCQ